MTVGEQISPRTLPLAVLWLFLLGIASPVFADTIYFPQVADGGGYSTTFTILNVTNSPANGTLKLFNQDGSARPLQINGITASQFSVAVPAGGSLRLTTPNSSATTVSGWALFDSTPHLQGVATLDYRAGASLTSTAGVISTSPATRLIVPVEVSNTVNTGVAIANVQSNSSVTVRLRVYNESGFEVANTSDPRLNPLQPQNQIADFVASFFASLATPFKGSLGVEVVGAGTVAVTGLTIKEGLLSAIPAIDASTSGSVKTPALQFPTITSISPSSAHQGSTFTGTLSGTNFVSGATTVQISGTGISVGSPQVNGAATLTVALTIDGGASVGNRTVNVTTSGGTSNGLTFSVAAAETDSQIIQDIINQSIASYSGTCPCPYSIDSAGRMCGGRSAYSRPGGAAPICYASDVTPQMISDYRKQHP